MGVFHFDWLDDYRGNNSTNQKKRLKNSDFAKNIKNMEFPFDKYKELWYFKSMKLVASNLFDITKEMGGICASVTGTALLQGVIEQFPPTFLGGQYHAYLEAKL